MNLKESIAYFKQIIPGEGELIIDMPEDDQPFYLPFAEDVAIFFLYDNGENFTLVQNRHVADVNMPHEELLERGINNLEHIRQDEIEIRKYKETLMFSGNGNLEASLLLIPELWDIGLEEYCLNEFIAAIPSRDVLAVCDRDNKDCINELNSIIEKVWEDGDHLLTKTLFVRENKEWKPYSNA